MNKVLCHLGAPRTSKPGSLAEYGKLRERMIMSPWVALSEVDFINYVTQQGCPFYSCLFNTRDLMELSYEKLCWRHQQFAGLDFDKCEISADDMTKHFKYLGMQPWLAYPTFSNGSEPGKHSYRLLWRTETDLNLTYEQCSAALKTMRKFTNGLADKNANNASRLWQGSNAGFYHYDVKAVRLNLKELASA
jgi:hypothetical protein